MHVVYSEHMVAPAQGYSPSAGKPRAVMQAWTERWPTLTRVPVTPVTLEDLYRAHDPIYVDGVMARRRPNGFGTRSAEVAQSLPYTCGALLTAARLALQSGQPVAAPVSGFHHACWGEGGGFCTFNGLMVAALALMADSPGIRVGILDYDFHYGNGTDEILAHLGVDNVIHRTAGSKWTRPDQAIEFLEHIREDIADLEGCDVVLYQAGADPHLEDPLGGFLTTAQLADRDLRVFEGLRKRNIPVAWDLAGGYQSPLSKVIDIHVNTFAACFEA